MNHSNTVDSSVSARGLPTPETYPGSAEFDFWIEAGRTEKHYWRDLWRFRELFFVLAWRDIAVRYKQTVAGAAWAVVQPLLSMIIMTVIFGKVAGLPSVGTAPYAVMVFAAILPWQFFSNALSSASQSLVGNANLISKVYFPRMIVPTSSVVVSFIDFLVCGVILLVLMASYRFWPTWHMLLLPFLVIWAIVAALGPGLIITALMVRYRDFRFLVPFIVQFGLYVSPVAYSSQIVREKFGDTWFLVYSVNPMVGVIDGFRWAILGGSADLFMPGIALSLILTIVLFVVSIMHFRKTERAFADVI